MVEHRLPKPVVAGSIPVSRSSFFAEIFRLRNFSLKENKRPSFRGITAMTSRS